MPPLIDREGLAHNLRRAVEASPYRQYEVAEAAGISAQALSAYVNGKRVPDALTVVRIADVVSVPVGALLGEQDVQPVPIFDSELGAGPGGSIDGAAVIAHVGLPRWWLRSRLGLEARRSFLAPVHGHSMRGVLEDGDLALGAFCQTIDRPGVYAAWHEGELVVKHARRVHGGGDVVVTLLSTSPAYPPIEVRRSDAFGVVGRIGGRVSRIAV